MGPVTIRSGVPRVQAKLTKVAASYPAPPQGPAIEPDDPDASFMLSRLDLYRQGREPLADVAYLCLTVLEHSAPKIAGGKGSKQKKAASSPSEEKVSGRSKRYDEVSPVLGASDEQDVSAL